MPDPIVSLNEESLKSDLRELIRRTVEEMPGGLLDEEADDLVGAERYERTAVILSTYFSPIAQTDWCRSRQRTFSVSTNALSPFSATPRPSSLAAGPSAGRTCP